MLEQTVKPNHNGRREVAKYNRKVWAFFAHLEDNKEIKNGY
jgi:hypothetical protein